jgi:hypothetical protein
MITAQKINKSSFRDPSGFIFESNIAVFRQINKNYQQHYDFLMSSGLYDALVDKKYLIPHKEIHSIDTSPETYKIIQPVKIAFISYPYEWSFSMLKDAALLTLRIQKEAILRGLTLKDASAYNIQFQNGNPIFIDTLSFEINQKGNTWSAYKQFCQHFLAPLMLMTTVDISLNSLLKIHIDGIPLALTSKLLPKLSWLKLSSFLHIHLHASIQKKYADTDDAKKRTVKLKENGLLHLTDSLISVIKNMTYLPQHTEWGEYYQKGKNNYSNDAFKSKKTLISNIIEKIKPKMVWDLGGNTGVFSRLASQLEIETICFDIDPAAVEINYLSVKQNKESHILPLLFDLNNPSSSIGWANKERRKITHRGKPDVVLALALVHHIAISNNVPLPKIAHYFASFCPNLIIEFVPKEDTQVKKLLATREDIFYTYNKLSLEEAFKEYFLIKEQYPVEQSDRTIYWLERI